LSPRWRGHAYRWQEICELRRRQLEAWKAAQHRQRFSIKRASFVKPYRHQFRLLRFASKLAFFGLAQPQR
jgi:hypothetical protein